MNSKISETDKRTYAESSLNLLNSWTSELQFGDGQSAALNFAKLVACNENELWARRLTSTLNEERNLVGKAGTALTNILQTIFKQFGIEGISEFLTSLNKHLETLGLKVSYREDMRLSSSVNDFVEQENLGGKAQAIILQLRAESTGRTSNRFLALISV